jgi:hypothetical protein
MKTLFKHSALVLAASGMALTAAPAAAVDFHAPGYSSASHEDSWDRHRRHRHRGHDYRGYDDYGYRSGYAEPVYRNTRVWRGDDGRTYCRKKNGTTGLIIGGAAGALLGREVDKHGDRTLGTILGAAAGALIGKELTDGVRCR